MLAVFLLMAIIVKFCGKKTPLVRRRRRRPSKPVKTAEGQNDEDAENRSPQTTSEVVEDEQGVQVHPIAIEAAVPFGKKVRKGEKRRKDRKKSGKSQKNSQQPQDQLAADLGRLIVDLPPQQQDEQQAGFASASSPVKGTTASRRSRTDARRKSRPSKSLSPEKTIAAGVKRSRALLAASGAISKSIEKLDVVSRRRHHRSRNKSRTRSKSQDVHNQKSSSSSARKASELKIGRFKFSLEMSKQEQGSSAAVAAAASRDPKRRRRRKKRSSSANANKTKDSTRTRKKSVFAHPSNDSDSKNNPIPLPPETEGETSTSKRVIVSKTLNAADRPLRPKTSERLSSNSSAADYRKKFVRSISTPNAPEPLLPPSNSEPKRLYELRRSSSVLREGEQQHGQRLGNVRHGVLLLPEVSDETRFSRLSSLKERLRSQWEAQQGGGGTSSLDSAFRRGRKKSLPEEHEYEVIRGRGESEDKVSESDSDSSSEERLSPPTQVQSLSEETSTASVGSKADHDGDDDDDDDEEDSSSFSDSEDDEEQEEEEEEELPRKVSRKKILAAMQDQDEEEEPSRTTSQTNLLQSSSSASSVSKDGDDYVRKYGEVPRLMQQLAPITSATISNIDDGEDDSFSILTEKIWLHYFF